MSTWVILDTIWQTIDRISGRGLLDAFKHSDYYEHYITGDVVVVKEV